MLRAPLLDSLHIVRAAEVIAVLRAIQPAFLIGLLPEHLTSRAGTILLPPTIAVVGNKQLLTMQAFAADGFRLHGVENPPHKRPAASLQTGRKSTGEEDGKRREQYDFDELGEEDGTGRRQQFQTGEFTPYSDRR
jgi:hypothetical protein